MSEKEHKIFISHSSEDVNYARVIVDLLEGMGIPKNKIFCSSVTGYGIPNDAIIINYLKKQFVDYSLHVLFIHSSNYYKSHMCLNEMGATWILEHSYTSILLPEFSFDKMQQSNGVIKDQKIAIKLGDPGEVDLQDKLDQLKDTLTQEFRIQGPKKEDKWKEAKNKFITNIKNLGIFKFIFDTGTITGLTEAGKQLTEINIPTQINGVNVTAIGGSAFQGCSSLTSITIPEGVTSIGERAFDGCSSLTDIYFGVTKKQWNQITGLQDAKINDSVTIHFKNVGKISKSEFTDDSAFTFIDTGTITSLTEAGKQLTEINIPKQINGVNVTAIGDFAFQGCSSLTSITIPASVASIGNGVFYRCSSLESINIPEGVTSNVRSIGKWAFQNCSSLTSIAILSSVTSIGRGAFSGCSSLTSVTISAGVTSIGESTFYGCSSLTSITVPEGVKSIGERAFDGCSSLELITISEGVKSIGKRAFQNCNSLTSITIPEGVTSIGERAFYGCRNLISINIPEGVRNIEHYAFYQCSRLTSITIPKGITDIGNHAFWSCISLRSITIPEGVTSIGERAFLECSSLESINIPEGVTSIGNHAFYGCSSLESINIPEGVTSIGDYAFWRCSSLTDIYFGGTEEQWNQITGLQDAEINDSVTIHFKQELAVTPFIGSVD